MKILGAIMAFSACIYAGLIRLRSLIDRETSLKALSESLMLLRNNIARTNDALPDIFSDLAQDCTGKTGLFFSELEREIGNIGENRFSHMWAAAIKRTFPGFDNEERDELSRLGFVLGQSDLETQIMAINNCEDKINLALLSLRKELPQMKKLALGLAATIGAFTVILLI